MAPWPTEGWIEPMHTVQPPLPPVMRVLVCTTIPIISTNPIASSFLDMLMQCQGLLLFDG